MLGKESRFRKSTFTIILELFLILVTVVLGLVVNEMRISYNEKQRTNKILKYMISEMESNSENLSKLMTYHHNISDSLNNLTKVVFASHYHKLTFQDFAKAIPKGFKIPLIESTGWKLLNNSGAINDIGLELSVTLSKLYSLQDFLQQKLDIISQNMYVSGNLNLNNIDNLVLASGFLINDIITQEEKLNEDYPKIIKKLKEAIS